MSDAGRADAVCVQFSLTRAEYQAAMLRLCWGLWFYRGFAGLAAIALLAGVVMALLGNTVVGLPLIGVGLLWSVLTGASLFVRPLVQYGRQPRLRLAQRHCFADDGITVSFTDAQSQLMWTFYEVLVESNELYLLRHQKRCANIIPRRAFASRDEERRFRQLAQQHMKVDFRGQAATA